jgi:hypothetical protein
LDNFFCFAQYEQYAHIYWWTFSGSTADVYEEAAVAGCEGKLWGIPPGWREKESV